MSASTDRPLITAEVAAASRCDLTELYVDQCAHCLGLPDVPPLDPDVGEPELDQSDLGRAVDACWPGQCGRCGANFRAGAPIRPVTGIDGVRLYVAECCWTEV